MKYPKDYITQAKNRETYDLSMSSGHELAYGICKTIYPKLDRNKHLWCYSTIALEKVEDWLKIQNTESDYATFCDFIQPYIIKTDDPAEGEYEAKSIATDICSIFDSYAIFEKFVRGTFRPNEEIEQKL